MKISLPGQGKGWRCRDVGPVIKPRILPTLRRKSPISARERAGKTPPIWALVEHISAGMQLEAASLLCSLEEGRQANDGEEEGFGSGGGHDSRSSSCFGWGL